MRPSNHHFYFIFSPPVLPVSPFFIFFVSCFLAVAAPQPQQDDPSSSSSSSYDDRILLLRQSDADPIGPGLLVDLTLGTGLSIVCVVAVYAGALVFTGAIIAILSPIRKRAITNGIKERKAAVTVTDWFAHPAGAPANSLAFPSNTLSLSSTGLFSPWRAGFATDFEPQLTRQNTLSLSSNCISPIVDPLVKRQEVMDNRHHAQDQLADLYSLVLQQDEKRAASQVDLPSIHSHSSLVVQAQPHVIFPTAPPPREQTSLPKRVKPKPANLSLNEPDSDKPKSKGSALLAALLSPGRKKKSKGLNISSPLMTPTLSSTPFQNPQEMQPLSPRLYMPAAPPLVPAGGLYTTSGPASPRFSRGAPRFPLRDPRTSLAHEELREEPEDEEHEQEQDQDDQDEAGEADEDEGEPSFSIEGRLADASGTSSTNSRRRPPNISISPISVNSQSSQTPLVGLPSSPKPSVTRFSGLPQSPKPGATFQTQVPILQTPMPPPQTAVRTNGALALRAYESSGEAVTSFQVKQTVFERTGMLSPASPSARVPYSPYQPFTPCVPITPALVTKEDRRRMRRLEPKTPTVAMVQSNEDLW